MKQKLTYQPSENFELIVIATALKDYRVSFFVNSSLHLELEKTDELKIDLKQKSTSQTFEQYYFQDELSGLEYFLIGNKTAGGVFLNSVKNFDFLLIVKYDDEIIDTPSLAQKLRNVKEFQAAMVAGNLSKKDQNLIRKYV